MVRQVLIDNAPATPRGFADAVFVENSAADDAPIASERQLAAVPTEILFYSVTDAYGEFSNFASYPIKLDGKLWPTSEHYFQGQKFVDPEARERIRRASSPAEAARIGRSRKLRLRPDWEAVKVAVMRRAVQAKFEQHTDLAAILLATGDAALVEHTPSDEFWGDGGDGSGRNMLGRILVDVRALLGKESAR